MARLSLISRYPDTPLLLSSPKPLHRSGWYRGWSTQFIDQPQDFPKQVHRHGDFRHLERDIATMADNLGSDLDQLSRSVVSDQYSTSFGNASVRMKFPRL